MTLWVAITLTWLAGASLIAATDAAGRRYDLGLYLALGFVPGCALAAALHYGASVLGGNVQVVTATGLFLAVIGASAWWFAMRDRGQRQAPCWQGLWQSAHWWRWGVVVIMVLAATLLIMEGLTRPIYPWDAWSAWSVKAKVWLGVGPHIDFVNFDAWLDDPQSHHYTNEAWQYPELLPRLQLWGVGWLGAWSDSGAMVWWGLLWVALLGQLGFGLYRVGLAASHALLAAFAFSMIPIAATQIALPGYADIWVAASVLGSVACWAIWLAERRRGFALLALIHLLILVALKLEGAVWAIILATVFVYSVMPQRQRRWVLFALPVLGLIWWLTGGFAIELGAGLLALQPDLLAAPYLGRYPIDPSNPSAALAEAFLVLPNWHLYWYLVPPMATIVCWRARQSAMGRAACAFLLLGVGFLFTLFYLTHASEWVDSMTASNRLALQFSAAALFWVVALYPREPTSSA